VLFDKILEPERALETMILQQVQVLKLAQVSVNAALLQLESGANHREETQVPAVFMKYRRLLQQFNTSRVSSEVKANLVSLEGLSDFADMYSDLLLGELEAFMARAERNRCLPFHPDTMYPTLRDVPLETREVYMEILEVTMRVLAILKNFKKNANASFYNQTSNLDRALNVQIEAHQAQVQIIFDFVSQAKQELERDAHRAEDQKFSKEPANLLQVQRSLQKSAIKQQLVAVSECLDRMRNFYIRAL